MAKLSLVVTTSSLIDISHKHFYFQALGVDTEDDIYLLSNYFLNRGQRYKDEEQLVKETSVKEGKDEDEKGSIEDTGALAEEGDKKDDDSSVAMSMDEKESQSSSMKAHLSGMFIIISCCNNDYYSS